MDNNTLAIYMNELSNQAIQTKGAFDLFNQALEAKAPIGVLFALNSVMLNASQLSAILWPPRARARTRAEKLREILQLQEKHALNDRRLTEYWDRSDEKMDEWIASTKGEKVVFDYVGPFSELDKAGIKDAGLYRAYDPERKIYFFRGVGYNIETIAKSMMEVGSRIMQVHQQMFPPQEPVADQAPANDGEGKAAPKAEKKKAAPKKKAAAKPAAKAKAAPKKKAPAKAKAKAKK